MVRSYFSFLTITSFYLELSNLYLISSQSKHNTKEVNLCRTKPES